MQPPRIDTVVYDRMFPYPGNRDPQSFLQLVDMCIIPEVRHEVQRFYGPPEGLEQKYPGLDYNSKAHRLRLKQYAWHRRMFRVFDEIRASPGEIYDLCRWEGTIYAKDRYEREHGHVIRDTTWDVIRVDNTPRKEVVCIPGPYRAPSPNFAETRVGDDVLMRGGEGDYYGGEEASETDDEIFTSSVGDALQQHLIAATAARARGEPVVLDTAWEQWMKEETERGFTGSSPYGSFVPPSLSTPLPPLRTFRRPGNTQPSVYRSPLDHYRYGPTTVSPSSRSLRRESSRRMAPPPILPRPRGFRP